MNELSILKMIYNFPVGGLPDTRNELLSKVSIIAYLARYQDEFAMIENPDEREDIVKKYLSNILLLEQHEFIPNVPLAEKILKLSNGFIQDYGKMDLIKQSNPNFSDIYKIIAQTMEQSLSGKSR